MSQQNCLTTPEQIRRLAFISSQAFSLHNFRGSLIRSLTDKGVQVYALAPDYDEESRGKVRALGAQPLDCSMSRAGMNPVRDIIDLCRLARQLRALKPDATFAYFIKPVIYGTLAAALAGIPHSFAMIEGAGYVFNEHIGQTCERRLLRRFVGRLYKSALRCAHLVFLLNRDDRQLFVESGMVSAEKVILLNGIGVDLADFSPEPPQYEPLCFIMIARLLREKGVCEFVSAARIVKSKYPGVRFLLLGATDENPGSISQNEINCWVTEKLIECPGHVKDVRPWIKKASVFVLPSYREGMPRSTQEAMAMARPVITTEAVGCKDTVEEGVNGFKVPVRDPEALAKIMLYFVENPEIIANMGAKSREMAEAKYDASLINAEILSKIGVV
ncbi:glycosyltransferase family 4 protein [Methylotuvimicrobium sp.]|uniref:glycosyltransferase family 4 protein n=1 Tax=Methylotuvimicrobium sp. TaxID=2822413 RepID=UPI003D64C42F